MRYMLFLLLSLFNAACGVDNPFCTCNRFEGGGVHHAPPGWVDDINRIVELQAEAWGDPLWPETYHNWTNITLSLTDDIRESAPGTSPGETILTDVHSGSARTLNYFTIYAIRKEYVEDCALPWELGHVYRYMRYGISGDDTYMTDPDFWTANTRAIDKFRSETPRQ